MAEKTRLYIFILIAAAISACSTTSRVEKPPGEMARMIMSGEIELQGEYVSLYTADGDVHKFRVTDVDAAAGVIRGKNETVAINEIVAVEMKEADNVRTGMALAAVWVGVGIAALLAAPAFLPY